MPAEVTTAADPGIEVLSTFNAISCIIDEGLSDLLAKNIKIDEEVQVAEWSFSVFRMFVQLAFSSGHGVDVPTGNMGCTGPETINIITIDDVRSHVHQYLQHRAEGFLMIRGEADTTPPECSGSRLHTPRAPEPSPSASPSPDASADAARSDDDRVDDGNELELMKPGDVGGFVKWLEENPQSTQFALQPAFRRAQQAVLAQIQKQ